MASLLIGKVGEVEMTEYIIKVDEDKKDIMGNCPLVEKPQELVRCKDCVNSGTSRCPCHYSGDPYIDWTPDDDWFCADGEMRTDDA